MARTYYEVLGVSHAANTEEIKAQYRKLAKENHPDLHPGDAAAEARFKEIGEAWDTLGDKAKRKAYDKKLAGDVPKKPKKTTTTGKAPVGKVDINEMMKDFGNMFTEEHYQQKVDEKTAKKGPIDSDDMFARFMGIKK